MTYIPTKFIDVFDKLTAQKVLELDLSNGVSEAAKQFAGWWNGGVLLRSADPKAPALTAEEVLAVAHRDGIGEFPSLGELDLCLRYTVAETGRKAYPEPHVVGRGGYISEVRGVDGHEMKGPEVLRVLELVHDMCSNVVHSEPRKAQAQRREIAERFAETQAGRYEEGLEFVKSLNARRELRDAILALPDGPTKVMLMTDPTDGYPELFSGEAAEELAEGVRMETYADDVKAWQDARTPEGDGEAAHNLDTTGTAYVESPAMPEGDGEGEGA